jgi:hypothetical protein
MTGIYIRHFSLLLFSLIKQKRSAKNHSSEHFLNIKSRTMEIASEKKITLVHCNLQERANQSEMYKQKSIEFTQQERE